METAQEERNEGEKGDKTRKSGEDGERKCVLEELSRPMSSNFGEKMNVSKDGNAGGS